MDSLKPAGIDHDRYRKEVLLFPSEEAETAAERSLFDEACQLGLEIPEVETAGSLAASVTSSVAELSSPSPVISSVCSDSTTTDRPSFGDATNPTCRDRFALDSLSPSLSEVTLSSSRAMPGSPRSIASRSTRPPSFSSGEGTPGGALDRVRRHSSALNAVTPEKKEKRRRSLVLAFGKIYSHSRKSRSPSTSSWPSTVPVPSPAQSTKTLRERHETYAELKKGKANNDDDVHRPDGKREVLKVEIPVYDDAALQRSVNDPELAEMFELHKAQRNRYLEFQTASLHELRRKQQTAVAEMLSQHKRLEDEKREMNTLVTSRMEERQLAVEMDQRREFERAKMNSRTRIKHMEQYFNNSTPPPPPTPRTESSDNGRDVAQPVRRFTSRQKAQLAQEYRQYESMDQLHEAKIKVLRDRQERKLQEAIARTEKELDDLIDLHAEDLTVLQQEHRREEASLMHALDSKKIALQRRWYLEEAVLRKKLGLRHGQPYGPLPDISFSEQPGQARDSAICVTADNNNNKKTGPTTECDEKKSSSYQRSPGESTSGSG